MQISWHELLSWFVAIESLTLFVAEKIKKPGMQYYMALQGILMACYKKAVFYYGKSKELAHVDRSKLSELRDYVWLCDHISNDFNALTQHVMGTMKSIEYKKDIPFDVNKFINSATNQKDYSQQNKNTQV